MQYLSKLHICIVFLYSIFLVFESSFAQDSSKHLEEVRPLEKTTSNNNENTKLLNNNTEIQTPTVNPEELFLIKEEDPQDDNAITVGSISAWDTIRVFLVLGLVIVGIYAVVWFLKKIQKKSFTNPNLMDILSSRTLSGGGALHLIKMGKSIFFIGSSGQNMTLLKEIQNKEDIDEIQLSLSYLESDSSKYQSFFGKLEKVFQKRKQTQTQHKNNDKSNYLTSTFDGIKSMFKEQIKRSRNLEK